MIPWGVAGYFLNITTGLMFLVTAPDQYILNPSFHFKIMFMGLAGLNIMVFYSAVFRRVTAMGPGANAPLAGKIIGGASLLCWTGVIVAGRMLTFYRPGPCKGDLGFLLTCFK